MSNFYVAIRWGYLIWPYCSEILEYVKKGTANIFVAVEFKAGKRVTQVTKQRTMKDFARFVKMLVDEVYPDVELIRLVTDNLNTHNEKAFYETFSKDEAERILSKTVFHYTPIHASWLNAAEIEINVMDIECTGKRIGDMGTLSSEVAAWTERRNEQSLWQNTHKPLKPSSKASEYPLSVKFASKPLDSQPSESTW